MIHFLLASTVFRNHVAQQGRWTYLLKTVPLCFLNILILSTLFSTARGTAVSLELFASQYTYFVPLLALTSAVGSWETELLTGIGEEYLLRPSRVLSSRLFIAAVEGAFPVALFAGLLVATRNIDLIEHLITLGMMFVCFTLLGAAIGFCLGFRHEKAVNNFLNAVTWVLGFGPGPFFGAHGGGWRSIFPGGFSGEGLFALEWIKLAGFAAIAIAMLYFGRRPRRGRFFSR